MARYEDRSNPDDGEDVLSTVRRYFDSGPAPNERVDTQLCKGDQFLAWLWLRGFKIVPLTDDDLKN